MPGIQVIGQRHGLWRDSVPHALPIPDGTSGGTSVLPPDTDETRVGDLMLFMAGTRFGKPTTPTGWTLVADTGTYTNRPVAIFGRTYDGTEGTNTPTVSGGDNMGLGIVSLREASLAGEVHASDFSDGTTTPNQLIAPSVSAPWATTRVFVAVSVRGLNDVGPPADFMTHARIGLGDVTSGHGVYFGSVEMPGGTVGPFEFTVENQWGVVTLAIESTPAGLTVGFLRMG